MEVVVGECNYCELETNLLDSIKGTLSKCHHCKEWYCDDCWKESEFYFFNDDYFEDIFGDVGVREFSGYDGQWICKNCWYELELDKFNKKYTEALKSHRNIKIYPNGYSGRIPDCKSTDDDYIETEEYFSKDDAIKSLQVIAGYYKYNFVIDYNLKKVEDKSTGENSNYIRNYWKAYGYGAKLKKKV
jgi:hypothetical protein